MFVWIFHRISGVLLILLLSLQFITGFHQVSSSNNEFVRMIARLHEHVALMSLLGVLCIFHGLYGLRTILIDLGIKREKSLFWFCTGLGTVLSVVFVVLFISTVPK